MIPPYCDDRPDPCCDCLYETVHALVEAAYEAVVECLGADLCKDFERSVTLGPPQGGGDYVAGWLGRITPRPSQATRPGGKQFMPGRLVAPVNIRLVESGFPVPVEMKGGRMMLPKRAEIDWVSLIFYGHAEKVTRRLLNAAAGPCAGGCSSLKLVGTEQMTPESTFVAWNWTFEASLDW